MVNWLLGTTMELYGEVQEESPDPYGNTTGMWVWTNDKGTLYGFLTNQKSSNINGLEGQSDTSTMMAVLPPAGTLINGVPTPSIDPTDQVEINGMRYHVQGSPSNWERFYRGAVIILEVPLKATQP